MIKQESFKNDLPTLYIVATPIGNLDEMTPRAIEILKMVDVVACEDTRHAGKLFSHFEIKTKLLAHHAHNEHESAAGIIKLFETHKNIALVSDAGYPLISDPGQTLVTQVIEAGFNVVPISGSSAFLNALVVSGLVTQPFAFIGFMEHKEKALEKQLLEYKDLAMTTVFYLSVHKLEKTLEIIYNVLGNRRIALARELTKRHEEIIRGSVEEVMEFATTHKGEFVIVIDQNRDKPVIDINQMIVEIDHEIEQGLSSSRAIALVSKKHAMSKNELYAHYHQK